DTGACVYDSGVHLRKAQVPKLPLGSRLSLTKMKVIGWCVADVCVCVCVCVCEREREKEKEKECVCERGRNSMCMRKREREINCVCVCVCVSALLAQDHLSQRLI